MQKLLPDELKELWQMVDEKKLTGEQFYCEQEGRLERYRQIWKGALLLPGHSDLKESLVWELAEYLSIPDRNKLWQRCCQSTATMKNEWEHGVNSGDRKVVEKFYDESQGMMDELVWWHTLESDASPLAYVVALQFAQQHPGAAYLDFGSGIGSGGILFARHGFDVSMADISPSLLGFDRWRFQLRDLPARIFDTSTTNLPKNSFDFITAMDVFEHLYDPVETAAMLWTTLKPGGLLFGRFGVEEDENKPQHIVKDFGPMFERIKELGMNEIWQDEWLWGHQVFQKT